MYWHVSFFGAGNANTEFIDSGTFIFTTRAAADRFVENFTGTWVGEPYQD